MGSDIELNRLGSERDAAKRHRETLKIELDKARWRRDVAQRDLGNHIDTCKNEIERCFYNKRAAANDASNAYQARDHYGAKSFSNEVRRLQDQINRLVDEKRHAVDQLRWEKDCYRKAAEAYAEAKQRHQQACDRFQARLDYVKKEAAQRRAAAEAEKARKAQSNGSTLYDRSLSRKDPSGASGAYSLRGDQRGHSTQYYEDNTRVSWNTDGKSDSKRHWTNQNLRKKHPRRHKPPPHAR
jgi:chromosome segregation ATPase